MVSRKTYKKVDSRLCIRPTQIFGALIIKVNSRVWAKWWLGNNFWRTFWYHHIPQFPFTFWQKLCCGVWCQKELGRPCVMTCSKKLEKIFAYKLVRFYIGLYMLQRGLAKNPIRIRYSPLWTVLEVQHSAHFKLGITLGSRTKNIYLNIGFHINSVWKYVKLAGGFVSDLAKWRLIMSQLSIAKDSCWPIEWSLCGWVWSCQDI